MLSIQKAYSVLRDMRRKEFAVLIAFTLLISGNLIAMGVISDPQPPEPYPIYGHIKQYGEVPPIPGCNVTVEWWNTTSNDWSTVFYVDAMGTGQYSVDIANYSDGGIVYCNVTYNPVYGDLGYNSSTIDLIGSPDGRLVNITCGAPSTQPSIYDLFISPSDIRLSNPNPSQWEEITISAEIHSNDWVEEAEEPPIQVIKTVDKSFASPGDFLVYTIYFNNTGTGPADYVYFNDALPVNVTYISDTAATLPEFTERIVNGQSLFYNFSNVGVGVHSFMITVVIDSGVPNGTLLSNYVTCNYSPGGILTDDSADTIVQVQTGPVHHIEVTPNPVTIPAGLTIPFTAMAFDQFNNTIPGVDFNWSTNVGSVDATGFFTAQTVPGSGMVAATNGSVTGLAFVDVIHGPVDHIIVFPSGPVEVPCNGTVQFIATAYDAYNNPIPGAPFNWSTNVGNITQTGFFTAQATTGNGYVNVTFGNATASILVYVGGSSIIEPIDHCTNLWHYPSGGNYWSDFRGNDIYSKPGQNIPGNDGIGDTPYPFDFSQDNYPLVGHLNFSYDQSPLPIQDNVNATCTVSFYLDSICAENLIYREYEVPVPSNGSTVVSHDWFVAVAGNHTIIVDITDSNPAETDLSNNTASKNIYISDPYGKLKVKASSDKQKYIKGVDDQAEIIVKVTYHGQKIEEATVWAWVIDTNEVNTSVAMSEVSPGIYTGIYPFTNESSPGTYRIKAVASKPGYINGENNDAKDKFFLDSPVGNVPEVSSVAFSSDQPIQGSEVIVQVDVTNSENVNTIYSKLIGHRDRTVFMLPLYDDGTHWDLTAGDGVFTSSFSTEDMSDTFSADIIINNILSENRAALVVNSPDMISLETITGLQTTGNSLLISSGVTNTTLNITTTVEVTDISFTIVEHRTINNGKSLEIIPSGNADVAMVRAYIELSYTAEDIPDGENESDMRLYLYNIFAEELESCLPGGVNTINDIVWGETEHFSDFKFIVDTIPPAHENENPVSDGYSRSTTPTISVEVTDESGIESSTIRLYVNGYSVFYELVDVEYGYRVSYTHGAGFAEGEIISCRIVAKDVLANVLDWYWSFTILHSSDIPLSQGWNLVSLPFIQIDMSIMEALSSIDGKWDHAQYYDATDSSDPWKTHITSRPASLNDLWNVNHQMAFWLHTTEVCTLTAYGQLSASTNIPLYAGWNLVGYPTQNTETVANALWGTGADEVLVCDTLEPYHLKEVGSDYPMKPGEGYWVHVPFDTIWVVDW